MSVRETLIAQKIAIARYTVRLHGVASVCQTAKQTVTVVLIIAVRNSILGVSKPVWDKGMDLAALVSPAAHPPIVKSALMPLASLGLLGSMAIA